MGSNTYYYTLLKLLQKSAFCNLHMLTYFLWQPPQNTKPVFKTIILFKRLSIQVSSLWHYEILP